MYQEKTTTCKSHIKLYRVHLTVNMIDYSNKKITIFIHISLFKGGIDAELLTLAYEPEAAAIYCKEYAVQKNEGAEGSNLQSFEHGQKFLVLDCGGRYMHILSDNLG